MNKTTRLIQERLAAKQDERDRILKEKHAASPSQYRVRFTPCGHVRFILYGEDNLLNKAQMHEYGGYSGLIELPSDQCTHCEIIRYASTHQIR